MPREALGDTRASAGVVKAGSDKRVLVVGLGSVGRRHAENLVSLGCAHVEVCSERHCVQEFSVGDVSLRVFHEYEAALDARPDVVVIANTTNLHASYAARAIERGCHVYLDKPAALSAVEALPLADLARARSVTVAIGCQLRFNACLESIKAILGSGRLGRIVYVHAQMGEFLPDYHPDEDYRQSYAARAQLGGGVLRTQIHDINYLHWLFGRFETVYAVGGKSSDLEIDVEDNVSFLLRSRSGVGVAAHMDFLQRPRRRALTIAGEWGSLYWDYDANSVRMVSGAEPEQEVGQGVPLDRNGMFLGAMRDFFRCMAAGCPPRTTLADGIADLRVVDAVRASFTTNTLATIVYDDNGS